MSYSTYDPQSKKWNLTINNPSDYGFTRERLLDLLNQLSLTYLVISDEISEEGTPHTHIYLQRNSNLRFSTIKRKFPTAHIERAYGSAKQNRDYLAKDGKWGNTEKAKTSVEGSFYEWGNLPTEQEERSPAMSALLQALKDGLSTTEIIESFPQFGFKVKEIDLLRETLKHEKYRKEKRPVHVIYLFGASGAGKTSSIYEAHGAENICRVTDYGGPNGVRFDAYHGQAVIVFEEFHSQIPIENMLNYLDIYPLMLPARYSDRVACYTTVYITSNLPLEEQYEDIQRRKMETWRAFLRRIHTVREFQRDGTIIESTYGTRPKF